MAPKTKINTDNALYNAGQIFCPSLHSGKGITTNTLWGQVAASPILGMVDRALDQWQIAESISKALS